VITVEGESAYTVKIESHQGAVLTREILVAKRIGECPK